MNRAIALDRAGTILDCLDHYAACQPEAPAYTFVGHKEDDRQVLSYGELHRRATGYAAGCAMPDWRTAMSCCCFPPGWISLSVSSPALMRGRYRSRPTWRATAITTPASGRSWKTPARQRC